MSQSKYCRSIICILVVLTTYGCIHLFNKACANEFQIDYLDGSVGLDSSGAFDYCGVSNNVDLVFKYFTDDGSPCYAWKWTGDYSSWKYPETGINVPFCIIIEDGKNDVYPRPLLALISGLVDTTKPFVLTGSITFPDVVQNPSGYVIEQASSDVVRSLLYDTAPEYSKSIAVYGRHYCQGTDWGVTRKSLHSLGDGRYRYYFVLDPISVFDFSDTSAPSYKWYRIIFYDADGWCVGSMDVDGTTAFIYEPHEVMSDIELDAEPTMFRVMYYGQPGG